EALQRSRILRDQRCIIPPAAFAIDTELLRTESHRIGHRARPFAQQMQSGSAAQLFTIDRDGCGHAASLACAMALPNPIIQSNSKFYARIRKRRTYQRRSKFPTIQNCPEFAWRRSAKAAPRFVQITLAVSCARRLCVRLFASMRAGR